MTRPLKIYVWFMSIAGIVAVAVAANWGSLEGLRNESHGALADLAFFVLMGCLLDMMIVPMARGGSVSAGFAVFYACVLILGPYIAAFVAVLANLWTDVVIRRGVPFYKTLFNVGHSALSILAAGAAYYLLLGGQVAHVRLTGALDVFRLAACAVVLFGCEVTAVNLAVALERRATLRSVWVGNARLVLPLDAALAGVGLLVALLYQYRQMLFGGYGWLFIATVILLPTGLLYYGSRLYMDMYRVYDKTLRTLVALKESKASAEGSGEVVGHGERVATLAVAAADELGLPAEEVRGIQYAGYLHDIGEIAVPTAQGSGADASSLNDEQVRKLERHAEIGYDILHPITFLEHVAVLVRYHDRRFDDGPYGADGEEIPIGSRLLAVAERYDELTVNAQAPLSAEDAMSRLVEEAGTRLDPRAVQAFVHMLGREAIVDPARCAEALHAA